MKVAVVVASVFCFIFTVVTVLLYAKYFPQISDDPTHWGIYGDYLGGVLGVSLGFFAVAGALYTASLQRRQLLKVIEDNVERQDREEVIKLENIVGQLLDVLDSIVRDSSVGPRGQVAGRRVFDFLYRQMKRRYKDIRGAGVDNATICCRISYDDIYSRYGDSLGAYFRTLYLIFKTIDSQKDMVSRNNMISWVKCRLTRFELVVIYYNCAFGEGRLKFKPLIEKYSILEHLDHHLLFNSDWYHYYDSVAFGGKIPDSYSMMARDEVQLRLFD